jgi:hypothetical protein
MKIKKFIGRKFTHLSEMDNTTNNPTNNLTTCVDEIRSVTFNKNLDRMGTSKRKQKALLHRERKENATNTRRLEIQKVIIFTNINILIVFIHSNHVVEFEVHQMMQLFHSLFHPQSTVVFAREHQVLLHEHHAPYKIITQMCTP